MTKVFVITGAKGHLGSTLIRLLEKENVEIRGLILPGEIYSDTEYVHYIKGDVRDIQSLYPLFENSANKEIYVIHAAGLIDISDRVSPLLYEVNVKGTKNIITLCQEHKVKKLLYVSSVHAIPEKNNSEVLTETKEFSAEYVVGGYAKTKAEATKAVLEAEKEGLAAVVVHPSGILGPYDRSGNHIVQMITDYLNGTLPACVRGGYDFVDVRDVAQGCLLALEKGKSGSCYILSNRHYEIKEVLGMVYQIAGGKKLPVLPLWIAKLGVPVLQRHAKRKKERPLYTSYSLYALAGNDRFSHNKATSELGYCPRDLWETVKDTVAWYKQNSRAEVKPGGFYRDRRKRKK